MQLRRGSAVTYYIADMGFFAKEKKKYFTFFDIS